MNKILFFTICFSSILKLSSQSNFKIEKAVQTIDTVFIKIDSSGQQIETVSRVMDFILKNTGTDTLIIERCLGGGRGFAKYPNKPILPGKKAVIHATFYYFRYKNISDFQKDQGEFETCLTIRLYQRKGPIETKICLTGYRKDIRMPVKQNINETRK